MASEKYDVLDYLQSSGTQYINVGLTGNRNTKFECKVNKATASSNNSITIFGNMEDESYSAGRISFNLSTNSTQRNTRLGDGSNDNIAGTKSISLNTIHTVILSRNGLFVDGTNIPNNNGGQTLDGSDFTCGTLYLFAINGLMSQPNWFNGNTRIYYAKIWDGDTLVRDFVPVKRKSDSVLGMYDLVNKEFYTNAGTGTFTAGNVTGYFCETSVSPEGTGTTSGDGIYTSGSTVTLTANPNSGYKFTKWELNGYTRLDYIESTGTQYINCNLASSKNIKLEIDCLSAVDGYSDNALVGISNNNGSSYRVQISRPTNNCWRLFCDGTSVDIPTPTPNNTRVLLTYEQTSSNTQTLTVGEDTVSLSKTTSTDSYTYLFSAYGGSRYYGKHRIYSAKIWKDDTLVRQFIPVIRHSDAQIGMFDLVDMKFYGNAGTGTFVGGGVYAS